MLAVQSWKFLCIRIHLPCKNRLHCSKYCYAGSERQYCRTSPCRDRTKVPAAPPQNYHGCRKADDHKGLRLFCALWKVTPDTVQKGFIPVSQLNRTHTGTKILLYEDVTALGGIVGNFVFMYRVPIPGGTWFQSVYGLFAGIFVGCWALSLTDALNVFLIFIRRIKLVRCIPYIILGVAIGKGIGSFIYFFLGW